MSRPDSHPRLSGPDQAPELPLDISLISYLRYVEQSEDDLDD